jgi:FimV-like protein
MKKFFGFLIIIILFAYIPIYSIWPIDYSSKTASILILLGEMQVIILENLASLIAIILPIVLSLLNIIGVLILDLSGLIISLPYEKINPLYVIAGLFIIGYFSEKFRDINNKITQLNKKVLKQSESLTVPERLKPNDSDTQTSSVNYSADIDKLNNKADSIMKLLEEINSAADIFKSKNLRSKKARRKSARDAISIISNNAARDEKRAKDEEQLMRLRKDAESLVKQDNVINKANAIDEIIGDENISQIDLARALIASSENEDAKSLLKKIVENGSEDQKHEAKLLFMQLK